MRQVTENDDKFVIPAKVTAGRVVIPAEAGTQFRKMDPRVRGDDVSPDVENVTFP